MVFLTRKEMKNIEKKISDGGKRMRKDALINRIIGLKTESIINDAENCTSLKEEVWTLVRKLNTGQAVNLWDMTEEELISLEKELDPEEQTATLMREYSWICPYCGQLDPVREDLLEEYPKIVSCKHCERDFKTDV